MDVESWRGEVVKTPCPRSSARPRCSRSRGGGEVTPRPESLGPPFLLSLGPAHLEVTRAGVQEEPHTAAFSPSMKLLGP